MKVFEAQYQRELTCGLRTHPPARTRMRGPVMPTARRASAARSAASSSAVVAPASQVRVGAGVAACARRAFRGKGTDRIQQRQVRLARTEVLYAAARCMHELAAALGEEMRSVVFPMPGLTHEHDAPVACERAL